MTDDTISLEDISRAVSDGQLDDVRPIVFTSPGWGLLFARPPFRMKSRRKRHVKKYIKRFGVHPDDAEGVVRRQRNAFLAGGIVPWRGLRFIVDDIIDDDEVLPPAKNNAPGT